MGWTLGERVKRGKGMGGQERGIGFGGEKMRRQGKKCLKETGMEMRWLVGKRDELGREKRMMCREGMGWSGEGKLVR